MNNNNIRVNKEKYFQERWRNNNKKNNNNNNNNNKKKDKNEQDVVVTDNDKDIIKNILCNKLPKILNKILSISDNNNKNNKNNNNNKKKKEKINNKNKKINKNNNNNNKKKVNKRLYLFNEHYVVKPPHSDIVFQWHRDIDKQLSLCYDKNVVYYSMWCPLDDVDEKNGTLQVPHDTIMYTVDVNDIDDIEDVDHCLQQDVYDDEDEDGVVNNIEHGDEDDDDNIDLCLQQDYVVGVVEDESSADTMIHKVKDNDRDGNVVEDDDSDHCAHQDVDNDNVEVVNISLKRGGCVIFSSFIWHCSGPNMSDICRRVLYAQYSQEVISCVDDNVNDEDDIKKKKRKRQDVDATVIDEADKVLCFAIPCDVE